jgi:flagellar biosynthetic protein FliO
LVSEFGTTSLKMFGSLLIVLGMILLLFYLAKRLKLRYGFRSGGVPELRLLETLNLAPKRGLALVEFSGQWLIVGIGTERVSLIARMDRPPGGGKDGDEPLRQTESSFQKLFSTAGLLGKRKKPEGQEEV